MNLSFKGLLTDEGRWTRGEYARWSLVLYGIHLLIYLLFLSKQPLLVVKGNLEGIGFMIFVFLFLAWVIINSVIKFMCIIRRLHDCNYSEAAGKLMIPLVIFSALSPIMLCVLVVVDIIFVTIPGSKGENKYGEDPRMSNLADKEDIFKA